MSENPFDMLLFPDDPQQKSSWRWATVEVMDPLGVRLDGDAFPLTSRAFNLGAPVSLGDRVWVQLFRGKNMAGTRVFIHGRSTRAAEESRVPYAMAAGQVSIDGAPGEVTVLLPPGRFTRAPIVTMSGSSTQESPTGTIKAHSVTSTKFIALYQRSEGWTETHSGTREFAWHAIQMTATSAEG